MDINLRYVAAVTSKRGPHFPQPLAEQSYQSYLKYLEEKLTHGSRGQKIKSLIFTYVVPLCH